jgi:hypothetical protein
MLFPPKPDRPLDEAAMERRLALVPVANRSLRCLIDEPDQLVYEVQLRFSGVGGALSKLLGARRTKRVELIYFPLELYRQIDGETSVGTLVEQVRERHLLSFFEARGVVFYYLSKLAELGVIAVAVPESVVPRRPVPDSAPD